MSNAVVIINKIDDFLNKFSLKKNKLTDEDLKKFIEEKWKEADNEKYNIYKAHIIIARMTNEYIRTKDFPNMMRWLEMSDLHSAAERNEMYIRNYYKGQCCLECGNENKALEYFYLSYNENPDYIFTRAPFCYEFFNKHLGNPNVFLKEKKLEEDKTLLNKIELKEWQSFFNEKDSNIRCQILLNDEEKTPPLITKYQGGIDYLQNNQMKILESILTELLKVYPEWQERYDYNEDDKLDFMPDIMEIKDFANILSTSAIYITSVFKDNIPYIGYLFSCSWDSEHGLGVMTYKDRIIEMEGADCAFSIWSAEEDKIKHQ